MSKAARCGVTVPTEFIAICLSETKNPAGTGADWAAPLAVFIERPQADRIKSAL